MLMFYSCNNDYSSIDNNTEKESILQTRDSRYPWEPYSKIYPKQTRSLLTFDDCIGRGYKSDYFPAGCMEGITSEIIDLAKLQNDHPEYFTQISLNEGEANSFSFSDFNEYTSKSDLKKTVTGGASVNLGLFSVGAKHTMTKIFTSNITDDEKSVFGELDITYKKYQYALQMSSRIKNDILLNYISQNFKDELYNTTPYELLENYGGYVMSKFITGGRATALYAGTYSSNVTTEGKEKDMDNSINASYGFKMNSTDKDGSSSVSGNLGIGKNFSSGTSQTSKMNSLKVSVRTMGGPPAFSTFSSAQNLDNVSLDLSGWLNSLSDEKTHSIIEFPENGLMPIADLIPEKNIQDEISYLENGTAPFATSIQEPYISIEIVHPVGPCIIGTMLHTRSGDKIFLRRFISGRPSNLDSIKSQESNRISQYFGLKITTNLPKSELTEKHIIIDIVNFTKMTKFIDKRDNSIYLLYLNDQQKKCALSIHSERVIDDYAMRNFIESLPIVNMTYEDLVNSYSIDAL